MENYAFQAQLARVSMVGLVPDGLRVDLGFAGTMSEGPWAGHAVEGVDYLLIRPDGIGVIDARELVSGHGGAVAAVHAEGYVTPPFAMPPLAALVDPDFAWPDVDLPMHGSARFQASAPESAGLNHTVYAFTGWVNMSRGALTVAGRAISAVAAAAVAG